MKQEELASIRKEIREYEQRLASGRARERSTLERLDDMDRQTALIRTLLSQLNVQIVENEREILETIAQLNAAERELETLQGLYARSIISAYKRGRLHDTELLLSATSINLMFIRARYLKAFTIKQKAQAEAIRIKRESIASKKTVLEDKLQRQQTAVSERKQEETVLRQRSTEQKQLLDKVRQDNEKYLEQIRRKQAAANKIERLISDLIERERAKRAEAARKSRSSSGSGGTDRRDAGRADIADLPMRAISQTAFGRLKGRLPWPVAQGAVVGAFGEQLNKRLGTVTISNGIDIEVPAGSAVRSVADGVVSKIYFIPGYGNLVIVNHDDGFFTVYAHLSEIRVREDTRVKAGQVIATSGEGVIGPQIHFELWREKNKQNPLHWLAPR